MAFAFRFTSTHQDLLDSYEAHRTARTGMRGWVRGALVSLASLWLISAILVLTAGMSVDSWWQPVVWLGIPAFILFHFLVKPQLAKRHIRRSNSPSQEVSLTFTDAGVDVLAVGVISYHRSWSEIAQVINAPKGVLMTFTDGSAHWVPSRVFTDAQERVALAAFIEAHMPRDDELNSRGHR